MAQFEYYSAPQRIGFWLDCQTDLMDHFATRFVVPLLSCKTGPKPARHLNPVFDIDGESYLMATHLSAAVPITELGKPAGSLAIHRYEILKALDFLITGI